MKSVLSIGNFEACHLGHKKLIKNNLHLGELYSCPNLVLSFDPHPQQFFHPEIKRPFLLSQERKTRALEELGVSHHFILNFNHDLNHTNYKKFYNDFLLQDLKAKAITVGEDFHFGFERKGNSTWLKEQGFKDEIQVDIIPSFYLDNERVSSTRIRKILTQGHIEEVNKLLGHSFSIEGVLVKGDQLGRKIGFPTLNLETPGQILPKDAVYCGHVWLEKLSPQKTPAIVNIDTKQLFPAVFSIGLKPTLENKEKKHFIEAHLLDAQLPSDELYGWKASFYFERSIRDMIAFRNMDELIDQIKKDVCLAKSLL